MAALDINMGQVMREMTITIRVTGMRLATFRIRLAAMIFAFGGWVAGTNLVMDIDGKADSLI